MAQFIAGNDDLLNLILLCLPARSLHRFKSVSKHWLAFISDPNFMFPHFSRRQLSPSLLYLRHRNRTHSPSSFVDHKFGFIPLFEDGQYEVPSPPFTTKRHKYSNSLHIHDSCNGLLLCSSFSKRTEFHVYNPTSNKFNTTPSVPKIFPVSQTLNYNLVLAFDPGKSPHYNIVYTANSVLDPLENGMAIYSSETRCWERYGKPLRTDYGNQFMHGIYSNGAIHWITNDRDSVHKYYNIEEKRFGIMPMLPQNKKWDEKKRDMNVYDKENFFYFKEWRNHLHLVDLHYPLLMTFDVYELDQKHYSEWFLKYQVDVGPVVRSVDPLFSHERWSLDSKSKYPTVSPLLIVGGDKDEQSANYMVLQVGDNTILKYNFADNTFNKFSISVLGLNLPTRSIVGYLYTESLYSV